MDGLAPVTTRRTSSTNQMPSKGLYGMRFTSVVRQLGRLPSTWPLEETWGDFPTTGKWLASDVTTCHWTRPGCSYLMLRSAKLISTWASPQSPDGRTGGPTTRVRGPVNRWRPAQVSHLVTGGKSKWLGVIIVDLPIIKIGGSFHSYVNVYQRVCSFPIIGGPSDCQKPSPSWPTTSATFTAFKST